MAHIFCQIYLLVKAKVFFYSPMVISGDTLGLDFPGWSAGFPFRFTWVPHIFWVDHLYIEGLALFPWNIPKIDGMLWGGLPLGVPPNNFHAFFLWGNPMGAPLLNHHMVGGQCGTPLGVDPLF